MIIDVDPIKWLDDAFCRARYGAGAVIEWPAASGVTGAHMETELRRFGVRVYARRYARRPEDDYAVTVPAGQAQWARYLVTRFLGPTGTMPRAWGTGTGPVGLSGRLISWIMG
jgi:hypothetical protein